MKGSDIRRKYIEFFVARGHVEIPSAPLVPINDPTTLFTSSCMQPLVPYLLGQSHPGGKLLVDSQKSFRSQDIEEVGDNRHTTFFEMLGNWSLGDYFKEGQLEYIWMFLTDTHEGLGLPKEKLYVSIFEGNEEISRDETSFNKWLELGVSKDHIFEYNVKKNWWSRSGPPDEMPPGEPGGPSSEIFFEFTSVNHDQKFGDTCHPNCDCGRFLEIGNSVFMQYQKQKDGSVKELPNKNVDFGGGLERIAAAMNNDPDVFKTDLFTPIITKLEELGGKKYDEDEKTKQSFRVIADHIKAAVMLATDGVWPGNKEQGYFSRRLIRRAIRYGQMIGIENTFLTRLVPTVANIYRDAYPEVTKAIGNIEAQFSQEEERFRKTLEKGLREFDQNFPNVWPLALKDDAVKTTS